MKKMFLFFLSIFLVISCQSTQNQTENKNNDFKSKKILTSQDLRKNKHGSFFIKAGLTEDLGYELDIRLDTQNSYGLLWDKIDLYGYPIDSTLYSTNKRTHFLGLFYRYFFGNNFFIRSDLNAVQTNQSYTMGLGFMIGNEWIENFDFYFSNYNMTAGIDWIGLKSFPFIKKNEFIHEYHKTDYTFILLPVLRLGFHF